MYIINAVCTDSRSANDSKSARDGKCGGTQGGNKCQKRVIMQLRQHY